jgi:transcriptional antiterminator NusG
MTEAQEKVQEKALAKEEAEAAPDAQVEAAEKDLVQQGTEIEQPAEEVARHDDDAAAEPELDQEQTLTEEVAVGALEAQQATPEQEGRTWYVIHSYSGYEKKVKDNLESRIESMGMQDYIFQVVVPTEEVVELRDGRRRTVEHRIFPGYILVDMIMTDESWFVVRNTPGVTGFVGSGSEPTPLRKEEADSILQRMEADAPKVKVGFRVGETVRIVDGPFTDFLGTVDDLNVEKGKVRLLVSFFGRETPVELDFLQVEKQ